MNRAVFIILLFATQSVVAHAQSSKEYVAFFEVPLVCGANESIGCGARSKPLLIDLEQSGFIKEAWLNRAGTYIGVALAEPYLPMRQFLGKTKKLFDNHTITFTPVTSRKQHEMLRADFRTEGKWYRGTAVDSLSWEEAASLANAALEFLEGYERLSQDSQGLLRRELVQHIGASLVAIRTAEELEAWDFHRELIPICERFVGADAVRRSIERYYTAHEETFTSTITCPSCGYKKTETLPTDRCIMEYTCTNCKTAIKHKPGDCCVFCSYGDVKCPTSE